MEVQNIILIFADKQNDIMLNRITIPHKLVETECKTTPLRIENTCIIEMCKDNSVVQGEIIINEHTLLMVLKGTLTLTTLFGSEITLHTNQMAVLPLMSTFKVKKTFDFKGQFTAMFFCLHTNFLDEYIMCNKLRIPRVKVDYEHLNMIMANNNMVQYAKILGEMVESFPKRPGYFENCFKNMMYELEMNFPDFFTGILALQNPERTDLESFMTYHYLKPYTVDTFARMSGRSLSTFKRDFYKHFQETPKQWINRKRMEFARKLMQLGKMEIKEVAYRSGFEYPQYFSKVFKEHYNMSPKMYMLSRSFLVPEKE